MRKGIQFILITGLFFSCDILGLEDNDGDPGPDIVAGLKEALKVGTDTATSKLAALDGYLKDEAVKILLPDEMEQQIASFKAIEINIFGLGTVSGKQIYEQGLSIPGVLEIQSMQGLEDQLIMGINRAAESAATEAGPIFFNAITSMSIQDANNILFGDDNAATVYLVDNTYDALFQTYEPKINDAISRVTIGNTSIEALYANFVTSYNQILGKEVPTGLFTSQNIASLAGVELLSEPDLSEFATGKGLDGLFLKIEEEEANIRKDPFARVTDLLEEVFGLLD